MQQHIFIQTESPVAPGLGKKASNSGDTANAQAFAAELNQQLQPPHKSSAAAQQNVSSEPAAEATEAATTAETENNAVENGNSLPPENNETAQSESTETTETVSAEGSEQTQLETVTDAEEILELADNQPSPQAESAENQSVATQAVSSEKPIRAHVEVSQQAVEHAKAAPVEMTARVKSEASAKGQSSPQTVTTNDTAEKTLTLGKPTESKPAENKLSVTRETVVVAPDKLDKLAAEMEQKAAKKALPNLASVLESNDKVSAKSQIIRADILDALQRKTADKDITANLRNQITAQLAQSAKNEISNTVSGTERPAQEKPPIFNSLLTPAVSPFSSLVATTVTASNAQVVSLPVQPGIQNPAWSQVISSRVVYMAKEGLQQAELRMTPANLGPVEVRLQVHNEQANVTFLAQHAATRDALEQALPRLRESFAEAGIELGQAEVGEQQQQQGNEAEHADDLHIFTQANVQSDDIETEENSKPLSGKATAGLSVYA